MHLRILLHLVRMFEILFCCRQDELVLNLAVISQQKSNLLASIDFQSVRHEEHHSVVLKHDHLYGA